MTNRAWHRWLGLAGWLLLTFAAAAFGSQFTPGAWYDSLNKPAWTPPSWIFGPVWTVLYALIGVAAWLVWERRGFRAASLPLALYLVQLALNAAWSWIFFGLEQPGLAAVEIGILWIALVATLAAFWNERRLAGALLVPYLIWVTFATALNVEIWRLNA